MDMRSALKSQYHAALATLKSSIEGCPDDLWASPDRPTQFWQIAYHTVFFTHLYLQPDEEAFRPCEFHRQEYQFLGEVPWPPHRPPQVEEPYTRSQVLEYWQACEAMIDPGVDRLDLDAADCGFPWYKMPKLEHQMMNIRHAQHHAAELADRVRHAGGTCVDWIGNKP